MDKRERDLMVCAVSLSQGFSIIFLVSLQGRVLRGISANCQLG